LQYSNALKTPKFDLLIQCVIGLIGAIQIGISHHNLSVGWTKPLRGESHPTLD